MLNSVLMWEECYLKLAGADAPVPLRIYTSSCGCAE